MLLACIDLTKYLENRMTFVVVVVQETARKCWKNQCYQALSFKSSTADRHLLLVNLSLVSWVTVEGCLLTDQCRHFFFFILKPVLSVTLASTLHIFYLDIKNTIQSLCCKKISTKILCCQMFSHNINFFLPSFSLQKVESLNRYIMHLMACYEEEDRLENTSMIL